MARLATLIVLVILIAGTTNYAEAKSGLVGAAGAAAAKQVGKETAQPINGWNCQCGGGKPLTSSTVAKLRPAAACVLSLRYKFSARVRLGTTPLSRLCPRMANSYSGDAAASLTDIN